MATTKVITSIIMKPTMQVAIALPVEKSSACLTAMTIAIRLHIPAMTTITPPKNGIKLRILKVPGELEKPIQRKSSPYVASVLGSLNSLVPIAS
jgi:hypothetical protein